MVIRKHRAEIDGLRAVAVVPVVLYHFGLGMRGGFAGVDVFFVVSGFLITSLILEDLECARFSLKRFWESRARRILPAAAAMTIASLVAGWVLLAPDDLRELGASVLAQSAFLSNVYFWKQSGYFAAPSEFQPMLHTWSLAVEEQFYLGLPLLLVLLWRMGRTAVRRVLLALSAVSLGVSVIGVYRFPDATFFLLPTRAWELLAGAVLAVSGGMGAGVRNRWSEDGAAASGRRRLCLDHAGSAHPGTHRSHRADASRVGGEGPGLRGGSAGRAPAADRIRAPSL